MEQVNLRGLCLRGLLKFLVDMVKWLNYNYRAYSDALVVRALYISFVGAVGGLVYTN